MTDQVSRQNSPLVNYALRGLEKCWLPEDQRWSHIFHLDKRVPANESRPESEVFYSLNVLLGFSRVRKLPSYFDLRPTFEKNSLYLLKLNVPTYAFGMALWASAELQIDLPCAVGDRIDAILSNKKDWIHFKAQDLGMLLAGATAKAKFDRRRWAPIADQLFEFLVNNFQGRSYLFFNNASGPRRRFSSFATHTYLTLACYLYGEAFQNKKAITLADSCTRKLISLQGPNGEWPWFFDTITGKVLDYYEVYSVHQYGMAPAFLELAEHFAVPEARESLIRGFRWVLGQNQLGQSMLVPELSLTIRSQVRKGELDTKGIRIIRSVKNAIFARKVGLTNSSNVELRLECRSYELGWILWSFGQRDDLPELTENAAFSR